MKPSPVSLFGAVEPTTGFYFRYTAADGPCWQAACADGGTPNVVNTNVVANTDFHRFRITSDGGMAEYLLAPAYAVLPLPPTVPAGQGHLVEPLAVALHALRSAWPTPGDEVLGLPRAFLHAGARAVLVSLWAADDAATAQLMTAC